jgi:hypothetical protein
VLLRAFSILLIWLGVFAGGSLATASAGDEPPDTPPPSTFNEFYPEERPLGDCLGSLPKPNCGSDARGGWAQYAIAVLMLGGLSFIGWRIVRLVRRSPGNRTPETATVPDDGGGEREP